MGKASSSKKVARAAKAAGRTKVRSNRGGVFPIALAVTLVVGLVLVVYARQSRPSGAAEAPALGDRWYAAYGIYLCDTFADPLQNQSDVIDGETIGIHSHGDGLVYIHPISEDATGRNANLGKFFGTTGIEMSSDTLVLPEGLGTWEEGDECPNGEEGMLRVLVWEDAIAGGKPKIYNGDFDDIRFDRNGMAITIAFLPNDTDLTSREVTDKLLPPSIPNLSAPNDQEAEGYPNAGIVTTTTTVAGETTTTTTVAGETTTTVAGETTTTPGTTAPATTAAASTTTTSG